MDAKERRKLAQIKSWQDVPITVADITTDVCAICPSGKTACPGWLNDMGLGKYCFESYQKLQKLKEQK